MLEIDDRNEKIGKKIRIPELESALYARCGRKEMADGKVSVRRQGKGDLGALPVEDFMANLVTEISNRRRINRMRQAVFRHIIQTTF